jgi:hypothetical protein
MIWLFIIFICIVVLANYWYIKTLKAGFTEFLKVEKQEKQLFIDRVVFHAGLFFKTAAKHHLDRKDFEELVTDTYNWLPIRGGGSGSKNLPGFWESIFSAYDVPFKYDAEGQLVTDKLASKKLADAMWLGLDHDIQSRNFELLMTNEERESKFSEDAKKYQY